MGLHMVSISTFFAHVLAVFSNEFVFILKVSAKSNACPCLHSYEHVNDPQVDKWRGKWYSAPLEI